VHTLLEDSTRGTGQSTFANLLLQIFDICPQHMSRRPYKAFKLHICKQSSCSHTTHSQTPQNIKTPWSPAPHALRTNKLTLTGPGWIRRDSLRGPVRELGVDCFCPNTCKKYTYLYTHTHTTLIIVDLLLDVSMSEEFEHEFIQVASLRNFGSIFLYVALCGRAVGSGKSSQNTTDNFLERMFRIV
jgi:hypothetical protein